MTKIAETEFEMFNFFELTPDLVCIANSEGYFMKVNKAVLETLEYTEAELFSRPISFYQHPDDLERTSTTRKELLEGKTLVNFDNRYITKTGNIVWLHWTSIFLPEKEFVFAIAKNITQKKQVEQEVENQYRKFKKLASHFKTSMEKDRKYFALELHEELAQLVAVLKMDIGMIKGNELPDAAKKTVEHAMIVSDMLISTIRKLSFSISPNMIGEVGLNETLKWLCNEFYFQNNIACDFQPDYDEARLSEEIKMDFYRICQKALANVAQHSGATTVKILIQAVDNNMHLTVTDNGKGFDPEQPKKGSGLNNMQERADSINAHFSVESEMGKGTKISVIVPG